MLLPQASSVGFVAVVFVLLTAFYQYVLLLSGTGASGASTSGRPAGAPPAAKRKAPSIQHPLAEIGGYKMPTTGRIGGAKGIGSSSGGVTKRKGQPESAKASKSSKAVSQEEAAAIAAREAAKKRVQQRTLSTFGLG